MFIVNKNIVITQNAIIYLISNISYID